MTQNCDILLSGIEEQTEMLNKESNSLNSLHNLIFLSVFNFSFQIIVINSLNTEKKKVFLEMSLII